WRSEKPVQGAKLRCNQDHQASQCGPGGYYDYAEIKPWELKRLLAGCHHSGAEEERGINPEQPALHRTAAPDCNHDKYVAGSNCQKRTKPVFPGFQAALRSYRASIQQKSSSGELLFVVTQMH